MQPGHLSRSITLPVLFLYGLGTMVGGGFYALSGLIAGQAGYAAPLSFLMAGLLAFVNVFTFAELSARFPVSAGEARYVLEAFRSKRLSLLTGFCVIVTGVVSAATLSLATVRFLQELIPVPTIPSVILVVLALGAVCAVGVGASVRAVLGITIIEVGALLFIVIARAGTLSEIPALLTGQDYFPDGLPLAGILSGAFLGFYAFIGFEDMVNMAEEVKNPVRSLPRAMIAAVAATTIIYVLVSAVMVLTVSPGALAAAKAPLAVVIEAQGSWATLTLVLISMLTGINGALVQIVMASRVVYGLGKDHRSLRIFHRVHLKTKTPLLATGVATGIVLFLALFLPLVQLAEATSFILLLVFALLNLALLIIRHREENPPEKVPVYPIILPVIAFLSCISILIYKVWA